MPTAKPSYFDPNVHEDGILHVGSPNVGDRALFDRFVNQMFDRRWFTNNGVLVQELEAKLCSLLNVKHCVAVSNATVGLQLAFHALDLTGEVIMPAFTFIATPHAAQWGGLVPVFADVKRDDHTICPKSIESLVNDRTCAIAGVHLWGNACDDNAIQSIADRHSLSVVYDAAHAFACAAPNKMIGSLGDCEVFSFHATKFFNTFEGGAITTNNDELAERLRLEKNFGFAGLDNVIHLGTNAKMPEICAAMGLSLLPRLEQLMERNRLNHRLYQAHLDNVQGLRLLRYDERRQSNWQYAVIEIDENQFGESRDDLVNRLHLEKIRVRRYFYPGCHRMEPYRSMPRNRNLSLSNTDLICNRVICLPTGSSIDETDIDRICSLIRGC